MNEPRDQLDVRHWLELRPRPPDSLCESMQFGIVAVAGTPLPPADAWEGTGPTAGRVALVLAAAALNRLEAALRSGESRDGALDLLAADALITYACEAAAEAGPAALATLVQEFGLHRLADMLQPEAAGS